MIIGDRIRLKATPACRNVVGLGEGQVGVVRDIDPDHEKPCLLISFSDTNVYTSALQEQQDFDVLPRRRPR